MRMIFGVTTAIVIWLVSLYFTGLFVDVPWLCLALSVVIASIIFFTVVFPHVTFIVPADRAWIIVNPFTGQPIDTGVDSMGFRDIVGQTEFQFGFHWKYPWEGFGAEVEMKREIAIKSDPERSYTFVDGHTIKLDWQITVVPFPGRIVNFHRTKEADIIRRVKTRAEAFFQGHIGSISVLNFDKEAREQLEHEFEHIYGGPEIIDPEENMLGIWTGTPEIYDIGNPKGVEEAINFEHAMEAMVDAALNMVERSEGHMKFDKAMDILWRMKAAEGNKDGGSNISLVEVISDKNKKKK